VSTRVCFRIAPFGCDRFFSLDLFRKHLQFTFCGITRAVLNFSPLKFLSFLLSYSIRSTTDSGELFQRSGNRQIKYSAIVSAKSALWRENSCSLGSSPLGKIAKCVLGTTLPLTNNINPHPYTPRLSLTNFLTRQEFCYGY
jgi:hypothetical protein